LWLSALAAELNVQVYVVSDGMLNTTDFFPNFMFPMLGSLSIPPEKRQKENQQCY
jgi:hypothetical protein